VSPVFQAATGASAASIGALPTDSPFDTPEYAAAEEHLGATTVLLTLEDGARVVAGCLGFWSPDVAAGRLRIPTAPSVEDAAAFWGGIGDFCRERRIAELDVQSFASVDPVMPDFRRMLSSQERFEYVLDLAEPALEARLSTSHRRNLRKAQKAGLQVARSSVPEDSEKHLALMRASMTRRQRRGEDAAVPSDARLHAALLGAGGAELFVATSEDEILSSLLVLKSDSVAYYHSAGSSPAGLATGSAQFLIVEAAKRLAEEGLARFNLGGADADAPGLRRFKQGFGTVELALEARTYAMASWIERKSRALVNRARRRLRLTAI
jgi:hypothetical protein